MIWKRWRRFILTMCFIHEIEIRLYVLIYPSICLRIDTKVFKVTYCISAYAYIVIFIFDHILYHITNVKYIPQIILFSVINYIVMWYCNVDVIKKFWFSPNASFKLFILIFLLFSNSYFMHMIMYFILYSLIL